jgi:pimeloyl-ACP methyl ester carboxylesterase
MSAVGLIAKTESLICRSHHRHNPEAVAAAREYAARRTRPDLEALAHRLALLDDYDPRPIARRANLPVYYLAGSVDPLVPWPLVLRWLRQNCPGYRGAKTMWLSHHNVLMCAPKASARQVLRWMAAPLNSPTATAPPTLPRSAMEVTLTPN